MKIHRFFLASLVAVALLGDGCTSNAPPITLGGQPLAEVAVPAWSDVGDGARRYEASYGELSSKGVLRLYKFPATGWEWSFEQSTSGATVLDWAEKLPEVSVLINGVYFHEDNLPSGAFVSHGDRIGTRSFDADKSALIVLAPRLRIADLTKEPNALDHATEAAQTFPYLIKDGTASVGEDSGKLAERSFVGTDTDGAFYVGIAVNVSLSLYELSQLLATQPIHWQDVVNLDGGPSTGIYTNLPKENRSRNSLAPVSNVLVGRVTSSASQTSPSP
ncbi:MAG: phosphodiester glycosidase family protein [Patescibacteria group bacterium]